MNAVSANHLILAKRKSYEFKDLFNMVKIVLGDEFDILKEQVISKIQREERLLGRRWCKESKEAEMQKRLMLILSNGTSFPFWDGYDNPMRFWMDELKEYKKHGLQINS